jgi:hypothetical protein
MIRSSIVAVVLTGLLAAGIYFSRGFASASAAASSRVPVVVELFTSEGCSSCPPADALLRKFDAQPFPSAELIVLSEHVDYWNHIGWTDPYSSHIYSERQSAYGDRLHLDGVYTPQMIVDGAREFVGSNSEDAEKAISKAAGISKIAVLITDAKLEGDTLHARIEAGPLPAGVTRADVILIAALENSGRRLTHVAVVRALKKAGSIAPGQPFSQEVAVKLEKHADAADLRAIALVQEPGPGKILGATQQQLSK